MLSFLKKPSFRRKNTHRVAFSDNNQIFHIERSTPEEIVGGRENNYMQMGQLRRKFISKVYCKSIKIGLHTPNTKLQQYDDIEIEFEKYMYLGHEPYLKYKKFYH